MTEPRNLSGLIGSLTRPEDIDAAIEAVHALPAHAPATARLAAALVIALMRTDLPADAVYGGERIGQIEGLLALADRNPPAGPDWPRLRVSARVMVLIGTAALGRSADPAADLAEIERLRAAHGGDPLLRPHLDMAALMLGFVRAHREGDVSARTPFGPGELSALVALGPQGAEMAGYLQDAVAVMTTRTEGGDVGVALDRLRERAGRLPPGHPLRTVVDEVVTMSSPFGPLLDGVPGAAVHPSDGQISRLRDLAADPGGNPALRALRHAALAGALLRGNEETDVGKVTEAVEHFRTAVELSPPPSSERSLHLSSVAMALLRRNELTNSLADLDAAAGALEEARKLAGGPRDPRWSFINGLLAQVQRRRGDPRARRFHLDALRSTAWNVLLQDDPAAAEYAARDAADDAISAARMCLMDSAPADAIQALDGGRSLMLFAAGELRDVVPRLREAGRSDLAGQWERLADPKAPGRIPAGLRADVLTVLAGESGVFDPPSLGEIRRALRDLDADALVYLVPAAVDGPGWAVIAPVTGPPSYLALPNLLVGSDLDVEKYLRALSTRDLNAPVARADLVDSLDTLCAWAWRAAMGPIVEQYVPTLPKPGSGRPHRLVLVPMGELALIPWQAARSPAGRYALESVAFSQAASARMLCRSAAWAPLPPGPLGLVVGDPDTRGLAPELTAARIEAHAIHQAFYRAGRYVGRRTDGTPSPAGTGTAKEVSDWLSRTRPGAGATLHLACHGVVETGPKDAASYLVLAGGDRLSAEEIVRLTARGPDRGVALAVLAACRTGRSIHGYDEAYSLGTAFLAGGVRSVLSTQWSIPDQATSVLMFMFHHYLMARRLPVWAALRQAQLWMLDERRQPPQSMPARLRRQLDGAEPAAIEAWAGFVHWGQ